jgi:hypothetical protein
MSRKTESEGHCLAASFGYLIKCICATKAEELFGLMSSYRQTIARYVLIETQERPGKEITGQLKTVEMQNPAHSLHTLGLRTPNHSDPDLSQKAEVRGLKSEVSS